MKTFIHKVRYYETDQMGIVHHSNYIRWFEEARIDWMEYMGLPYEKMEEVGLFSPVLSVQCDYKLPFRFGDDAYITVILTDMSNVKFKINYIIRNEDNKICVTGETTHCFVNKKCRPVSLKRRLPELYEVFTNSINKEDNI